MPSTRNIDRLLIDDYATYQLANALCTNMQTNIALRIEFYRDKVPMFERFNVEREIERALARKIWLPSGGYLFFDTNRSDVHDRRQLRAQLAAKLIQCRRSPCPTSIWKQQKKSPDNCASAISEVLIICDFIDMRSRKNQRRVLDRSKKHER